MRASLALASIVALAASHAAADAPLGAAVSHERGSVIALFDGTTLHVSRDDGASFVTFPSPVPRTSDVVIERDGTIAVLGDESDIDERSLLRRVRPSGVVEDVALPSRVSAMAVGGDTLALLFPDRGAIGILERRAPLRLETAPAAWHEESCSTDPRGDACVASHVLSGSARVVVDRDGTVHVVDVEIDTCGSSDVIEWARQLEMAPHGSLRARALTGRDATWDLPVIAPGDVFPIAWAPGSRGWVYGTDDAGRLATRHHGHDLRLGVSSAQGRAYAPSLDVVSNGAIDVAIVGRSLVALRGLHADVLDAAVSDDVVLLDVDARGRPIAWSERGLVRFSRRTGWERIESAPR